MIKKALTFLSMVISGISFSQTASLSDPSLTEQLDAEIEASCGHLVPETAEFKECVAIVSIDFTVFPHNKGGVVCPGQCLDVAAE